MELHPDERAELLERLAHRAERLAKCARVTAVPVVVLAMMTRHVISTALPLCGEELRTHFFSWLADLGRANRGCCLACGQPVHDGKVQPLCAQCIDEMKDEDEKATLTELDERGPVQ